MSPDEEWRNNAHRRRKCYAIILAGDPRCAICRQPGADSIDHIKPKSKFPELMWDLGNMQPAHRDCNSRKGDGLIDSRALGKRSRAW